MTQSDLVSDGLATADAEVQAEVLNDFVLKLTVLCKASPHGSVSMQGYYIAERLRGETIAFLRELVGTWEYLKQKADETQVEYREARERLDELNRQIREREQQIEGHLS